MVKIYHEALFHLRKLGVAGYFQGTFRMGNMFPNYFQPSLTRRNARNFNRRLSSRKQLSN